MKSSVNYLTLLFLIASSKVRCSVVSVYDADLDVIKDGCFKDDASNPVFAQPVSIDHVNPALCVEACVSYNAKFAALQGDKCLCGNSEPAELMRANDVTNYCVSPCYNSKPAFYCGKSGGDGYAVYSQSPSKLENVSVTTAAKSFPAGSEVIFTIKQPNGGIKYRIDCGLPFGVTEWIPREKPETKPTSAGYHCIYEEPGTYNVFVELQDDSRGKIEEAEQTLQISINSRRLMAPAIECPKVFVGSEPLLCNISIPFATDVEMEVTYGDGKEETLPVFDSSFLYFGEIVPAMDIEIMTTTMKPLSGGTSAKLFNGDVKDAGYVMAFEAYTKPGTPIDFVIARPQCSAAKPYCPDSDTCSETCPDPCIASSSCETILNYVPRTRIVGSATDNVKFSFGSFQFRRYVPPNPLPVFPGDKIAVRPSGAAVMMNPSTDGDEDLTFNNFIFEEDKKTGRLKGHGGRCVARAVVVTSANISIEHTYDTEGEFEIWLSLANPGFDGDIGVTSAKTVVSLPLKGLDVITIQMYVKTNDLKNTYFQATLQSGVNFNLTWFLGDGESISKTYNTSLDTTLECFHSYSQPGVYNVTAVAENHISSLSNSTTVYVQRPANESDWSISGPKLFLVPSGEVTIELQYQGGDGLPTNATVQVTWESEKTSTDAITEDGNPKSFGMKFKYQYSLKGEKAITVKIANNVSEIALPLYKVTLKEEITGLSVQSFEYFKTPKDANEANNMAQNLPNFLKKGFGQQQNCFVPGSIIIIKVVWEKGEINSYDVKLDNGGAIPADTLSVDDKTVISGVQNLSFTKYLIYKFSKTGDYKISIVANNELQSTTPIFATIRIINEMGQFSVLDPEPITNLSDSKMFTIQTDAIVENACFMIDFGDSSIELYGLKSICNDMFSSINNAKYIGPFSYNITHIYSETGRYKVFVKGCNEGRSCFNATLTTQIKLLICKPSPQAQLTFTEVNNTATSPETAYKKLMSKTSKIMTSLGLDSCTAQVEASRSWTVTRIDPKTKAILSTISDNDLNAANSPTLVLLPLLLPLGMYEIKFTAKIFPKGSPDNKESTVETTTLMYLEVIRSNLTSGMIKNFVSSVRRGYNQKVLMEPAVYSRDPDVVPEEDDPKKYRVDWFCFREDEIIAGEQPDYIGSPVVQVPQSKHSNVSTDKGGCFGTGPGKVDLKGSMKWELNTRIFYLYKVSDGSDWHFTVTVVVRKDERWTTTKLDIYVVKGNPPLVEIQCREEGLCRPSDGVMVINRNLRLALGGRCSQNCEDIKEYVWTAAKFNSDTQAFEEILNFRETYTTLGFDEEIAVFATFFETYNTTEIFEIRVKVITYDGAYGFSGMKVKMNTAPFDGTCDIKEITEPPTNTALFSRYKIACNGWRDHENLKIVQYTMYLKVINYTIIEGGNIVDWKMSLCYGPLPECVALLPFGVMDIFVDIEDELDAVMNFKINHVIETKCPNKKDYDAFRKSDWITMLKTDGNEFTLTQTFKAMRTVTDELDKGNRFANSDRALEEKSNTIVTYLNNMDDLTIHNLEDVQQTLGTIGTFLGDGLTTDSTGKNQLGDILIKIANNLDNLTISAPSQLEGVTTASLQVIGAIITSNKNSIVDRSILPSDMKASESMDYNTDVVISDMKEGQTLEDLQKSAIIREQKNQLKADIAKARELMARISKKLLAATVVNEPPIAFVAPMAQSLFVKYNSQSNNSNDGFTFADGGGSFKPPDVCTIMGVKDTANCSAPVSFAGVSWNTVLYSNGAHLNLISENTQTIEINAFSSVPSENITELSVKNSSSYFDIEVPRNPPTEQKDNCLRRNYARNETTKGINSTKSKGGLDKTIGNNKTNTSEKSACSKKAERDNSTDSVVVIPKLKWFEFMMYHQFQVKKPGSAANIDIEPEDPYANYVVFVRHLKKPTLDNYDLAYNLNDYDILNGTINTRSIFMSTEDLGRKQGVYYVGISQMKGDILNYNKTSISKTMVNQNFTSTYTIRIYTSNCAYYDKFVEDWKSDGCFVFKATVLSTFCRCNHLTAFAGGFFVMPNTIDFDYVFANASFADNLTIYMTIIVTLSLFIIFLIWARHKDKKDREKLGAIPLANNDVKDKYLYEILVFTGNDTEASTDSKISFVLTGDKDETDIKTFDSTKRKILRRSGVDVFIMTTPRPLGQLQFLRIWHDNSGKGNFASWYLNYIIFRDVQTGEKFEFICSTWLAVEKEDGLIDRVLPVASKDQLTEFNHLFNTTSRKNLSDGHLWFSVFMRPPRSRFTRCQRIASCMALLYLSMLVNCMWYGTVPEKPTVDTLKLGPFNLSLEQISIGFMSNIIVFPPSFLIIFFFRKARPRKLRPSRVTEALKKQRQNAAQNSSQTNSTEKKPVNTMYDKNSKFTLPWFFSVIAWILCICCIFVSIFFLWAYGIQFGNEKTTKWLTSILVAFFSSILITQPIKVFLLAMLFSAICKKVETDEDDADEDEESPELEYDEQWLEDDPLKPRQVAYKPEAFVTADIEKARLNRIKEVKMWSILREIVGYLIFLWILSVVGYGVRDPNAFHLRNTLVREFVNEGRRFGDFNKITNIYKFRNWFDYILLPRLKPTKRYNGKPNFGWMGLVSDGTNRLLGPAILRQIRVSADAVCRYHPMLGNMPRPACMQYDATMDEDTEDYSLHWKKDGPKRGETEQKDKELYKPFRYTKSAEYKTSAIWADMHQYSGGGYVYELTGNVSKVSENYVTLRSNGWIDPRTTALITEFSMYNAQVDLFSVVKLVLEMDPGGGTSTYVRINTLRLLSYKDGLGNFNLLMQLIWVAFVIYYTLRELFEFCKQGRNYFKQFWNIIETIVNVLSYCAIIFFIMRYLVLLEVLKDAKEGQYLKPVNLNKAQLLDEFFCYCISLIIFFAIIKFNKILRFNTRMAMLATSVAQCTKDLQGFAVVFAVGFAAFGVLFRLVFDELYRCKSLYATFTTLFTIMLNRFTFDNFFDDNPNIGPFIFFLFVFAFNIILINIFMAILIQSFEKVKEDLGSRPNKYNMMEFMMRRLKGIVGVGAKRPFIPIPRHNTGGNEEGMSVVTKELPEKVDRLLDYINDVYFEGKLDLQNKEFLVRKQRTFQSN